MSKEKELVRFGQPKDFQISLAGSNRGTLLGKGTYFSDSVTKADEYATPRKAGEMSKGLPARIGAVQAMPVLPKSHADSSGSCALLLCRVLEHHLHRIR